MDSHKVILTRIPTWIREYGSTGNPDNNAVGVFVECETPEVVRSLQAELMAVANNKCEESLLKTAIGPNRKNKYGSYAAWAKLMLNWLASHKQT